MMSMVSLNKFHSLENFSSCHHNLLLLSFTKHLRKEIEQNETILPNSNFIARILGFFSFLKLQMSPLICLITVFLPLKYRHLKNKIFKFFPLSLKHITIDKIYKRGTHIFQEHEFLLYSLQYGQVTTACFTL